MVWEKPTHIGIGIRSVPYAMDKDKKWKKMEILERDKNSEII